MSQQESINSFCNHFQEQFNQIVLIDNRRHQKILLVTAIDAISRAYRAPKPRFTRRFVNFIYDFGDWNDKDRVSLVQLSHRLPPHPPSKLRDYVERRLRNWKDFRPYGIDNDPMPFDLETLTTDAEKVQIEACGHANLLYEYRCNLIHEFREPGHGFESVTDRSPFYHSLTNFEGGTNLPYDTWELVYPVNFFISLTKSSLHNLKEHLSEKDIGPYSFYNFGTSWKHN